MRVAPFRQSFRALAGLTALIVPFLPTNSLAQAPSGDQRTIVIVANFADKAVSCSMDSIRSLMFDPTLSVAALYNDNSSGKVTFSGDVVGPFTLTQSSTEPCSLSGLSLAAETSAAAAGVDVSAYARRVYVMPSNSCGAGGNGTLGNIPSQAWVFACNVQGVFVHNLGHNLGMNHSSTAAPLADEEYGDPSDPMAYATNSFRGINAPHRHQLGWLAADSVQKVTQDGDFNIPPLALDPAVASAPQVIMIGKPDTEEYYYVSYRRQVGFDNYIDARFFDRLSVHRYKGDGSRTKTNLLANLGDGESFVDSVNGITVMLVSHNTSYATARIQFSGATCTPAVPSLTVSPQTQSGTAGSSINYGVSVASSDAPICGPATFALSGMVPPGWEGTVSPASVTIAPGGIAHASLTLTSTSGAQAGTYSATVTANSTATAASAGVTYVIPDAVSPTTPATLTATVNKSKKQILISWDASTDNVGVAGYRVWRNGAEVGTSATTSWIDQTWKAGASYTYSVQAYDAGENVSARSNSVTVNLAGGRR